MAAQDGDGFEDELVKHLLIEDDLRLDGLDRVRARQAETGCGVTTALIDLGLVSEARLRELRAEILGEPREPSDHELISQSSFESIYETPQSALPPTGRVTPLRPGEVHAPVVRALKMPEPGEPETAAVGAATESATPPDAVAPGIAKASEPAAAPRVAPSKAPETEQGESDPREESSTLDLVETVGHWHGDPIQEIQPLAELAEARVMLAAATTRQQVGWVLARHALAKAPRVVLLSRRGRAWVGWAGAGAGVRNERVERLVVPPVKGSVFGLVADTGAHYLGPLAPHPVHERFYRTLDIPAAEAVGIFPVHQDGEIEMALFLDAGPGGRLAPDVGEVLLVAMEVPRVLARIERDGAGN